MNKKMSFRLDRTKPATDRSGGTFLGMQTTYSHARQQPLNRCWTLADQVLLLVSVLSYHSCIVRAEGAVFNTVYH